MFSRDTGDDIISIELCVDVSIGGANTGANGNLGAVGAVGFAFIELEVGVMVEFA